MDMLFNVADVKRLAEFVRDNCEWYDDNDTRTQWGNTCRGCYTDHFGDKPVVHDKDCVFFVAKDVLTGLDKVLQDDHLTGF
jgi:hypothetical protein